jgi:hypothetical protein
MTAERLAGWLARGFNGILNVFDRPKLTRDQAEQIMRDAAAERGWSFDTFDIDRTAHVYFGSAWSTCTKDGGVFITDGAVFTVDGRSGELLYIERTEEPDDETGDDEH